jgi:rhodanese-related sulfurtransferase
MSINEVAPQTVAKLLEKGEALLIDVREPNEFAAERIEGALLFPLSTFDPAQVPACHCREVIFHCGTGMRSRKALSLCQAAGLDVHSHMAGGLKAWRAAGLPTRFVRPDIAAAL